MFQTGFAVKFVLDSSAWQTVNADDEPIEPVDAPVFLGRGTLLELEDGAGPRARLKLKPGVYAAGGFSAGDVADLNAYAADAIAAIAQRQDAEVLEDAARSWIATNRVFWWTTDPPEGVDANQRVRGTALDDEGLTLVDEQGLKVATIPIAEIKTNDLDFQDSEQESQERQNTLASRAEIALMSLEQVMAKLGTVNLISPHLNIRPRVEIKLAGDDDQFTADAITYLRKSGSNRQPADINAYTDRTTDPITILLRPGAQGVGTEVHEMLHALSADQYRNKSWFFFDEGTTEYLTRFATDGLDRHTRYPIEYDFISRLVGLGATDNNTLANLYFGGDWAGFEETLRRYTGDWVSFQALRKVNPATSLAVCDYLAQLHRGPEAPLDSDQHML